MSSVSITPWPMKNQYIGHVIPLDQSEASDHFICQHNPGQMSRRSQSAKTSFYFHIKWFITKTNLLCFEFYLTFIWVVFYITLKWSCLSIICMLKDLLRKNFKSVIAGFQNINDNHFASIHKYFILRHCYLSALKY